MADQLQTNYASDLRSILKTLFEVMATKQEAEDKEKLKKGEAGTDCPIHSPSWLKACPETQASPCSPEGDDWAGL